MDASESCCEVVNLPCGHSVKICYWPGFCPQCYDFPDHVTYDVTDCEEKAHSDSENEPCKLIFLNTPVCY